MSPLMTVGEFALATGLSAKALRFYDERGLLAPADVDAHSGYRRYEPGQIRTAAQIRVLRAAGLTVDDVRSVLADPASLPARLEASYTVSGHLTREVIRRAFQAQVFSVIPKPVNKHVVIHTMTRALVQVYGPPPEPPAAQQGSQPMNDVLKQLFNR